MGRIELREKATAQCLLYSITVEANCLASRSSPSIGHQDECVRHVYILSMDHTGRLASCNTRCCAALASLRLPPLILVWQDSAQQTHANETEIAMRSPFCLFPELLCRPDWADARLVHHARIR